MDKDKKLNSKIIIFASLGTIAVPLGLNFLLSINFPSAPHLGNPEWLSFWGGYLGGIVGMIGTIIALLISYQQNKRLHEEERQRSIEQNRLQIIPYMSIAKVDHDFSSNKPEDLSLIDLHESTVYINQQAYLNMNSSCSKDSLIMLSITNNGVGAAVRVKLACLGKEKAAPLADLAPHEGQELCFNLLTNTECKFILQFENVWGDKYEQRFSACYCGRLKFNLEDTSIPKLREEVSPS